MGNRKGQKHYPNDIREKIVTEYKEGKSANFLSKKYGISRYSISSWCGLRSEVNIRQASPLKRGRPTNKPEDLEKKVKRLEMENELLRNFLRELERK
mgnify:CR=1 FL=1